MPKNYVLFENALNAGKLLEEYRKFNVKVIILDEEGGITTKYQEKLPRRDIIMRDLII